MDPVITEALQLSNQLLHLADTGEAEAKDDGFRILYGVVRDCGYRIRVEAEKELRAHERNLGHGGNGATPLGDMGAATRVRDAGAGRAGARWAGSGKAGSGKAEPGGAVTGPPR